MAPIGSLLVADMSQKRCRATIQDRASISILPAVKRSWLDGAVGGVRYSIRGNEERRPWQEWVGAVIFLLLLAAAFLVLGALVRLAVVWWKRQLGDYRAWCDANERWRRAHDGGDADRWMPIANDEFFTVPEDMHIGYASAPRNGVVEDEDLERGRPLRRFWHFDAQNPRPGRVFFSVADADSQGTAARVPGRDIGDMGDADAAHLMRARAERSGGCFSSPGASSSSQSQWQGL